MTDRLLRDGWIFEPGFEESWTQTPLRGTPIALPHTAVELPWNYGDETSYQRTFTYQRTIEMPPDLGDDRLIVHFEGAMANTHVWINGHLVTHHADGYTPFEPDITDYLTAGANLLTVRIDGTENPAIPPFGGRIDYLTYAGLYRDVWLNRRAPGWISNAKIEIDDPMGEAPIPRISVRLHEGEDAAAIGTITATVRAPDGAIVSTTTCTDLETVLPPIRDPQRWSLDAPNLYTLTLSLENGNAFETRFGIRQAAFEADGFYLNGERLQIVGLNRHQSFAHIGYALGPEAQARDADILKYELGLNLVRTSHYPQSVAFLDRCDEIGLLVFEEIPGWQHIGDDTFKAQSLKNVADMIRRDWNHPSIILWGVRINESPDDDVFYKQTNALARSLDPTRQTGGVRCIPDSTLLEDVYTMNDFVLGEEHLPGFLQSQQGRPRTPLRTREEVTGLTEPVPYLVTEYNGHMYPTKIFDGEERQEEHVRRHLEVLDAAFGDPAISGSIGWCMADYNTHADFGSGDRICYHGVMSMGRAPKFAAHVYASQGFDPREKPVLEPATHWSFGDRKVGGIFPLIILTNCDAVTFHYGDDSPLTFEPARKQFPNLPYPPVIITDEDLNPVDRIAWGDSWRDGVICGIVDGEVLIERRYVANPLPTVLEANIAPLIRNGDAYHDRLIRFTACDQVGNRLPYLMDQLSLHVSGGASINGPKTIPLIGGVASVYVRQMAGAEATVTAITLSGILPAATASLHAG
ncbi:MAG: glycoside hydrolase family 2 protein [Devosiaceae bacterium]|nr:glycoside hydrolase family 2 protein [Devosiaceae bacterium MH13]